ncbi:MAG: diguanylate cyclase [Methylococcales bacterium]|nr:diguanylate cyclase [Methylococcales bacterium]MDD5755256.1 diguanylate cyclase [Methylococcales bacterium]
MIGNILIVDDEPSALKLLKDILMAECHHVRPFNNGELALRSVEIEPPDLILLDVRMPEINGFEVCRRLKEKTQFKDIPVIFISGASDMDDKIQAFKVGGVDYITKPFQKEEVIARVKTHVALHQTLQEVKRVAEALDKSEKSLKMAQSVAHLGHWECNLSDCNFYWSDETFRILGYAPQKMPASYDSFLQHVHPDDKARVMSVLNQALAGKNFEIEYRVILPDGEVRVIHGKGELIVGEQSKIIGTIQSLPECDQIAMLGVIQDITERKKLEWQLEELANTDYLTGCANRRHFMQRASQEFLRARRYGSDLSVLMLDLDHFKIINDKYGHEAGDTTLKKFVARCNVTLREVDLIGRIGGEEFAIMLPETRSDQAVEVAKRICQSIAVEEVLLRDQEPIHFTVSIGVANMIEDDAQFDAILKRADQALYQAKHEGRNRVVCTAS